MMPSFWKVSRNGFQKNTLLQTWGSFSTHHFSVAEDQLWLTSFWGIWSPASSTCALAMVFPFLDGIPAKIVNSFVMFPDFFEGKLRHSFPYHITGYAKLSQSRFPLPVTFLQLSSHLFRQVESTDAQTDMQAWSRMFTP